MDVLGLDNLITNPRGSYPCSRREKHMARVLPILDRPSDLNRERFLLQQFSAGQVLFRKGIH